MSKKTEKLYIVRSKPGFGYHAGKVYDVPVEQAEKLKVGNYARSPQETLPKDIPHREDLLKAGIETVEAVKDVEDLTKVKNIGKAGAAQIAEYLGESDEDTDKDKEPDESDKE